MTFASLFSGIGGAELAALGVGWEPKFWCEIEPFCQQVLKYSSAKDGEVSLLSPLFVEEMMGFPSGWTALPFLSENGETKR